MLIKSTIVALAGNISIYASFIKIHQNLDIHAMAILLQDIISYGKLKTIYGKAGEKVEIISENGNVLLVKCKRGIFPVAKNKIMI